MLVRRGENPQRPNVSEFLQDAADHEAPIQPLRRGDACLMCRAKKLVGSQAEGALALMAIEMFGYQTHVRSMFEAQGPVCV